MFKCEKFKLFEMYKVTKFSTPLIVDYFYKSMYMACALKMYLICFWSLLNNSSFLSTYFSSFLLYYKTMCSECLGR